MTLPSSSRNGQTVRLVVLHTAEGARTNSSLYNYFDSNQNASCHAGIDDWAISDNWVPYNRAAWTLRNGNPYSDNAEMCGFASWSREEWLKHPQMLTNAAAWVRSRCTARNIPIVKLSPAEVKAGKSGVCGHVDYTQATGDGTHWDPGPNFPWDLVIAAARGENKDWWDMATPKEIEDAVATGCEKALRAVFFETRFADNRNFADEEAQQTGSILGLQGQLDQVIAALQALAPQPPTQG